MPEESTAPDLVERWRHAADALGRSDFDAGLSRFAPDAVWEVQSLASSFEGVPAIRSFVEDWIGNYDEYHQELVEGQGPRKPCCFRPEPPGCSPGWDDEQGAGAVVFHRHVESGHD